MSAFPDHPILIAYDGSADADHAIDVAGSLLGGCTADLIHAWEPAHSAAARSAVYLFGALESDAGLERERERAHAVAERGAQRARRAGFEVHAIAASGNGPAWRTIVDHASRLEPRMIVMGSRGLTGVRAALGSVSQHVASHATVPVLTVPASHDA